ncbi:MAG: hypothetical protein AAB774_02030 [Patescibacteria group bacterium]
MPKQPPLSSSIRPGLAYLLNGDQSADTVIASFPLVDQLIFDSAEGDVAALRTLIAQVQLKAVGSARLVFIKDAHLLSEIMQNTLLKLLEEPPETAVIILRTNQVNKLLPTIMSRLAELPNSYTPPTQITGVFDQTDADIFVELTDCSKTEAVERLGQQMIATREQLLANPSQLICRRLELLDLAIKKLNQNANHKLTIDWLLLHWSGNEAK